MLVHTVTFFLFNQNSSIIQIAWMNFGAIKFTFCSHQIDIVGCSSLRRNHPHLMPLSCIQVYQKQILNQWYHPCRMKSKIPCLYHQMDLTDHPLSQHLLGWPSWLQFNYNSGKRYLRIKKKYKSILINQGFLDQSELRLFSMHVQLSLHFYSDACYAYSPICDLKAW